MKKQTELSVDQKAHETAAAESLKRKNQIVYVVRDDSGACKVVIGEPTKKHGGIVAGYVAGVKKLQVN